MPDDGLPVLGLSSAAEWDAWLSEHHAGSAGLWLKIPKKGSDAPGVSYPDALSVALCHGWIAGQKGRLDDDYWLQRFTPRRAGSKWSRINRDQATALIEVGQMRPAGLREVELARADVAEAQAAVEVAESRLANTHVDLKYAKIVAPLVRSAASISTG